MRREIVEAVREALKRGQIKSCCPDRTCDWCCAAVVCAVLRAALTGDEVVEAAALSLFLDCEGLTLADWNREIGKESWRKAAREALVAVANALNLSRDLAAGEQT